jgi:hypothetical protein
LNSVEESTNPGGTSSWVKPMLQKLGLEYNQENALMLLYLPDDVPAQPNPEMISLLPEDLQDAQES